MQRAHGDHMQNAYGIHTVQLFVARDRTGLDLGTWPTTTARLVVEREIAAIPGIRARQPIRIRTEEVRINPRTGAAIGL